MEGDQNLNYNIGNFPCRIQNDSKATRNK
jgi:hypothetical protein